LPVPRRDDDLKGTRLPDTTIEGPDSRVVVGDDEASVVFGEDSLRVDEMRVGVGSEVGLVSEEIDLLVGVLEGVVGMKDEAGCQASESQSDPAVQCPR
jgi:hypothetical protein